MKLIVAALLGGLGTTAAFGYYPQGGVAVSDYCDPACAGWCFTCDGSTAFETNAEGNREYSMVNSGSCFSPAEWTESYIVYCTEDSITLYEHTDGACSTPLEQWPTLASICRSSSWP